MQGSLDRIDANMEGRSSHGFKSAFLAVSVFIYALPLSPHLLGTLSAPNCIAILVTGLVFEQCLLFVTRSLQTAVIMIIGIAAMAGEVYSQQLHPVAPSDMLPILSDSAIKVSILLLACRISTSKAFPVLPGAVLLLLLLSVNLWLLFQRGPQIFWSMNESGLLPSYLAMRSVVALPFNSTVFELTNFGKLVLGVENMGASISMSAKKSKLLDNGEKVVLQANATLVAVLGFAAMLVSFSVLQTVGSFLDGVLLGT